MLLWVRLGALGFAGCARGVEDHGGVFGPAADHLVVRLTALQQRFELAGLHEHALHAGLLRAGVSGVGELVPGQDDPRLGVTEIETRPRAL